MVVVVVLLAMSSSSSESWDAAESFRGLPASGSARETTLAARTVLVLVTEGGCQSCEGCSASCSADRSTVEINSHNAGAVSALE